MCAAIVKYSALSIPGANQMSKIKPDETGYYPIILGGFNICNASGIYYPLVESVRNMFKVGGIFRRRLDTGLLRGEYGHPKLDGMKEIDMLNRLARMEALLTSHHIRSVELLDKKDERGNSIVVAAGMVKPSGPYGDTLQKQFDNLLENIAFSVRSFTDTTSLNGRIVKIITELLTYDYVTEPGISRATQYMTAAMEELKYDLTVTEELLNSAITTRTFNNFALEDEASTLSMVRTNLGWHSVNVLDLRAINL